jgi:hypothetical protein
VLFFQHDPKVAAGTVTRTEKGCVLGEVFPMQS